jgi:phosphoribosylformylglycinamidine (FGAM) synthase-like enzyme
MMVPDGNPAAGGGATQVQLAEFRKELATFAVQAEALLDQLEADPSLRSQRLSQFSEWMLTIRGTSEQLGIPNVSKVASMGEEIAARAIDARSALQRKATAALWDAVTTVKVLLDQESPGLSEEEEILLNRLNATLKSLGGAREHVGGEADLEALFKAYRT